MMNLHHNDATHGRKPSRRARLSETSTLRENIYEHRFLAEIGEELLARGIELEIMRGEIDRWGHDIVLEAGSIIRHTQLKVTVAGGARTDITVNTRLLAKPSACVVWLVYEPDLRTFVEVRWFGGAPGQALPDLGTRLAKHSRANSKGVKAERSNQRKLGLNKFERLADLEQLCDRLFGLLPADPLEFLRSRMSMTDDAAPRWVREVMLGDFHAIPEHLDWNNAASLAGSASTVSRPATLTTGTRSFAMRSSRASSSWRRPSLMRASSSARGGTTRAGRCSSYVPASVIRSGATASSEAAASPPA